MITPRSFISWLTSNSSSHGLYALTGDTTINEGSVVGIYKTVNSCEYSYLWTPFMELNDNLADMDFDEEIIEVLYFDGDGFTSTTARKILQDFYQPH